MGQILRQFKDKELNKKTRLSSKNNFELVYMRHGYLRKSTNPTTERLLSFKEMSDHIAGKIFSKNIVAFKDAGFELEDILSIAQIHTVSFISMGGLEENPDKKTNFLRLHKQKYGQDSEPKEKDVFMFECYSMSNFLKQRLNEMVRFCKNKTQNIRGTKNIKSYFVGPVDKNPSDEDLLRDHKSVGFTKINNHLFIKIRTQNSPKDKSNFIDKESGNRFIAVYKQGSFLTEEDMDCTPLDISLNSFYMNPEDLMILIENKK